MKTKLKLNLDTITIVIISIICASIIYYFQFENYHMSPLLQSKEINSIYKDQNLDLDLDQDQDQTLGAPLIYKNQIYPKTPFIVNESEDCKYGCGAMGECISGKCQLKNYNNTVFNMVI